MKLLIEDMEKLRKDYPGAKDFLEAAEKRYAAYVRIRRIAEKGGQAISGDACQEKWFMDRLKKEGISVVNPKSAVKKKL